jgi:hypothetical protein
MKYYNYMGIQREMRRKMIKEFVIGIGCMVVAFALMILALNIYG